MKLYGMAISSATQKVLTVFAEKGQEVSLIEVDALKGEDKLPGHLLLHPFGEIPVLEDEGFLLYESQALIRYLDERLPGDSLSPSDSKLRALMDQWISVEQSYFNGPAHILIMDGPVYAVIRQSPAAANFPPRPDAATLAKSRAEVEKVLDVLDKLLKKQEYLVGSMFTLAEVSWMPYLQYLLASTGDEILKARPHVSAWWQRISTRPSWQKVCRVLGRS